MENNYNNYNGYDNNNNNNNIQNKDRLVFGLNLVLGILSFLRLILFWYYFTLVGNDVMNILNNKDTNPKPHNIGLYLVICLAMLILGIILIVFHKRSKNKGISLANGIVAIIPIANMACMVLSIIAVVKKDKQNNMNNQIQNDNNQNNY